MYSSRSCKQDGGDWNATERMEALQLRDPPNSVEVTQPPRLRQAKRKAPPPPMTPTFQPEHTANHPPPPMTPTFQPEHTANHGLVIVRPAPPPPSTKPLLTNFLLDFDDSFEQNNGSKMQARRILHTMSLPTFLPTEQTVETTPNGNTETNVRDDKSCGKFPDVSNNGRVMPVHVGKPGLGEGQSPSGRMVVNDRVPGQPELDEANQMEASLKLRREGGQVGYHEGITERESGVAILPPIARDSMFEGVILRKKKSSSSRGHFENPGFCGGVNVDLSDDVFYEMAENPDTAFQEPTYHNTRGESEVRDSTYEAFAALDAAILSHSRENIFEDIEFLDAHDETAAIRFQSTGSVSGLDGKASQETVCAPCLKTEVVGEIIASVTKPIPKPAPRRLPPIGARTAVMGTKHDQPTPNQTVPRPVTRKAIPKRGLQAVNGNPSKPMETTLQRNIAGETITNSTAAVESKVKIPDRIGGADNTDNESSVDENSVLTRFHPETINNRLKSPSAFESKTSESPLNQRIKEKMLHSEASSAENHTTPTNDSKSLHSNTPQTMSHPEHPARGSNTSDKPSSSKEQSTADDSENNLQEYSRDVPTSESDCNAKLNWDPKKCFKLDDVQDPQMRLLFENAGVTDDELQDPKTREFIYRFLLDHGGMEAVKREAHFKATLRLVKRQPRNRIAKEYVPRKHHDTRL